MRPSWATVARLGSGVVETALFQFPTCSHAAAMALRAKYNTRSKVEDRRPSRYGLKRATSYKKLH
jgi:hypothetical protein